MATVDLYEAINCKVILPVFATIDIAGDTNNIRQLLISQNYLTGIRTDTLNFNANSYINSGSENSLFQYLAPNVHYGSNVNDFFFKNSPILGSSLICDTQKVMTMLSPKFNNSGIYFNWTPNGTTYVSNSKQEEKLLGLVAFSVGGKSMKLPDTEIRPIDAEPGILERIFYKPSEGIKYKYLVVLNETMKTKIKSTFPENAAIVLQCIINKQNYYFTGTVNEIILGPVNLYH
jgi:hypothetical protein